MTARLVLLVPWLVLWMALVGAPGCNIITPGLLEQTPGDAPLDSIGSEPPADMLVVHYAFEQTSGAMVTDGSPRRLHATLSDPTMWTPNGRAGRGIAMSGQNPATQFISVPSGLLDGVEDFTIAVWIKLSANPAWARIYDFGNGLPDPANRFMYLTPNGFTNGASDGIHASSYGGSATNESTLGSRTFLPVNVWKHVALTGAGGERRLYIDGFPAADIESGPAVAPREMEPIGANAWIGKSRFAADPGFSGVMDEFVIYSRVLSAKEIADLAWPGRDYSHWRFDENGGTAAADTSDRAVATALANGAAWTTGRLGGAVGFGGGAGAQPGPHAVLAQNPLAGCTNQLTISAWVRVNALTPGSRVFDFGTAATHSIFLAPTNGTGMQLVMKSPAGTVELVASPPPITADAIWHHVAVTSDTGSTVLYVDGAAVETRPSGGVRASDFANLSESFLGRSRAGDPYLNGAVDELRIGCRALTPDEIKNLAHP